MQRLLTDEEAADARMMINWTFWAPPTIFAVACIGAAFFLVGADAIAWAIFAPFVIATALLWIFRIRQYGRIAAEIEKGMVEVLEGAPEKVWMARGGMCYVRLDGKNIRIPNDRYAELRDANSIKIALLPTTLIAVRIDAGRGIGFS